MIRTLMTSFRLTNAYGANTVIYRLKHFPFIKKWISADVYKNRTVKRIAEIISALIKMIWAFTAKFMYLGIMIALPSKYLPGNTASNYISILFWFALFGMLLNTELLNESKYKYYTVVLFRTDAKKYALSSYVWFLLKLFVTMLPPSVIIGRMCGLTLPLCLAIPVLNVSVKPIGAFLMIKYFEKTDHRVTENNVGFVLALGGIALLLGYGLIYIRKPIPVGIFHATTLVSVALGIPCFVFLCRSRVYQRLYKKMLTTNSIIFHVPEDAAKRQQSVYISKISDGEIYTGNKRGYDYFNAVFIKRHRKILTNSAKKMAFFFLAVIVAIFIATQVSDKAYGTVNKWMLTYLPYFVFIMYLINRGSTITQAMFMNCDHSMLPDRFYRQPDAILGLFKARLKTIVKINLAPALVIACGLPFLLFVTGGTSHPMNYLLLFVSILAMSVFFSVHHLVLYYLLQPYNVHMESKSGAYTAANWLTYLACYMFIRVRVPTLIFASLTILFSAIYILVALILVYKYAPRYFKLKQ